MPTVIHFRKWQNMKIRKKCQKNSQRKLLKSKKIRKNAQNILKYLTWFETPNVLFCILYFLNVWKDIKDFDMNVRYHASIHKIVNFNWAISFTLETWGVIVLVFKFKTIILNFSGILQSWGFSGVFTVLHLGGVASAK